MKIDWSKISDGEYWLAAMQRIHKCEQCGRCCQKMDGIAYNVIDAERMAKHLNMSRNDWMKEMTIPSTRKQGDRWIKLQGPEAKCPYLSEHGCTAYEGRGQVCRYYPWYAAEQVELARKKKPLKIYQKCQGMINTYLEVLQESFDVPLEAAHALLNSGLKQMVFLGVLEAEGKGEAAKYAARELGLEDVPGEEQMRNMAHILAVSLLALHPIEQRELNMTALYHMLED